MSVSQVVQLLLRHKADVNFVNEHGNSAMHYACFWGYTGGWPYHHYYHNQTQFTDIAEELVDAGALVAVQNKYQVTDVTLNSIMAGTQNIFRSLTIISFLQEFTAKNTWLKTFHSS